MEGLKYKMETTLIIDGLMFSVAVERDEDMGDPWKEHDGHGVVSEWTSRPKRAGERILAEDHGRFRYYDFAGTVKIALKDGWGVKNEIGKTKRQIATEAAEVDFQYCQGWCRDEWSWVGVVVTLLDVEGTALKYSKSLWGIESSDGDYLAEVAKELASELAREFEGKDEVCTRIRY